ncbi:hypothetical protein CsSME_00039352 [Camellia sinensis var. sinensis]
MSSRIANIRKRLDMIADDRTKFHSIVTTSQHKAASSSISSEINELEFVGRVNDRVTLFEFLMTPTDDDDDMSVFPIGGMGGIGKTALVKFIYNHEFFYKHFQLRIWVKVGLYFNVKDVMQTIIQCITDSPSCADLNSNQLKNLPKEKLQNKKCSLVLDNLCDCDYQDWHKLYDLLRCSGAKGSKIIVTTRNVRVAIIVGTVPIYHLESLFDEDCLKLLWTWAGCHHKLGEEHVIGKLSDITEEIVNKCRRCPRAAKTLGNKLFMETDR